MRIERFKEIKDENSKSLPREFFKLYKASLIIDNVVKKCSKFHPQHRQYMPKMVQLR